MAPTLKIVHGLDVETLRDLFTANLLAKMIMSSMWSLNIHYLIDTFTTTSAYFFIHDGPDLIAFAAFDYCEYELPSDLHASWDGLTRLVHNRGHFDKKAPFFKTLVGHISVIASSTSGYGALLLKEIMSYAYHAKMNFIVIEALRPLHITYYPKHFFQETTLLGQKDKMIVPMIRKLTSVDSFPVWWTLSPIAAVKRLPLDLSLISDLVDFSLGTNRNLCDFLNESNDETSLVHFKRFFCRYLKAVHDFSGPIGDFRSHAQRIFNMRSKITKSSLAVPSELPCVPRIEANFDEHCVKAVPNLSFDSNATFCNASSVLLTIIYDYHAAAAAAAVATAAVPALVEPQEALENDGQYDGQNDGQNDVDNSEFRSKFKNIFLPLTRSYRSLLRSDALIHIDSYGHRPLCNASDCVCVEHFIVRKISNAKYRVGPSVLLQFEETFASYVIDTWPIFGAIETPSVQVISDDGAGAGAGAGHNSGAGAGHNSGAVYSSGHSSGHSSGYSSGHKRPYTEISRHKRRQSIDLTSIDDQVPSLPESDGRAWSHLAHAWSKLVNVDLPVVSETSESHKNAYLGRLVSDINGAVTGSFGRPPPGHGRGGGAHRSIESKKAYLIRDLQKAADNGVSAHDIMQRFITFSWGSRRHPLYMPKTVKDPTLFAFAKAQAFEPEPEPEPLLEPLLEPGPTGPLAHLIAFGEPMDI